MPSSWYDLYNTTCDIYRPGLERSPYGTIDELPYLLFSNVRCMLQDKSGFKNIQFQKEEAQVTHQLYFDFEDVVDEYGVVNINRDDYFVIDDIIYITVWVNLYVGNEEVIRVELRERQ